MAQQTTTIIEDLQSISSKILELSKTDKLPENDAIELNNDLLKIYKKINIPTLPNTQIGLSANINTTIHSQDEQYQTGLTYTYTYINNNNEIFPSINNNDDDNDDDNDNINDNNDNINDNNDNINDNNNDEEDNSEEEPEGEYYDYTPRGNITISTTITPTLITPLSYNLLLENSSSTSGRRL